MLLFNLKFIPTFVTSLLITQLLEASTTETIFVKYPNKYFIESGSFVGDGIQMAINAGFKIIYSIELKESFYENNLLRFAFYPFVKSLLGDSTDMLPIVLKEIDAPATFWLDGHYSGSDTAKGSSNTPLLAELNHISHHPIKTHTILIDDIRQFGTKEMDFITLEDVLEKIRSINPNYEFIYEDGYKPGDVLVAIVQSEQLNKNNFSPSEKPFNDLKKDIVNYLKDSWCSQEKTNLLMDLILFNQPEICVEIGVFSGSSILPVAATLKYLNYGVVFAIDAWSNQEMTKNMEDNDPNKSWWSSINMAEIKKSFEQMVNSWELQSFCKIIHNSSQIAANEIDNIDFLHLDGDYSENGSLEDVLLYFPKVKQNGYILISNLHMLSNKKYSKQKAFALLFKDCEVIRRIENGNAVLLRKL